MNIEELKSKLKRGMQIVYVPLHANGDIDHLDCEPGFVTSVAEHWAFCRFWMKGTKVSTGQPILRTKANSEAAPYECIVIRDTVNPRWVTEALKEWC